MNSIMVIHPYKFEGRWVFDDEKIKMFKEPFVLGTDVIIGKLAEEIPDAELGFSLGFSDQLFPGYNAELEWRRAEMSGNWYYNEVLDAEGWLSPALSRYFKSPPKKIYLQFKPKAV